MHRKIILLGVLAAIMVLATACTGGAAGSTTGGTTGGTAEATEAPQGGGALENMKTEVGDGEGAVSIVAWPGYIERGESDKAYDWVTQFEADSGCKVEVKTAATSDEMVALMNQGGFDLVTASGDA